MFNQLVYILTFWKLHILMFPGLPTHRGPFPIDKQHTTHALLCSGLERIEFILCILCLSLTIITSVDLDSFRGTCKQQSWRVPWPW
jgi:hypothetical protein